MHRLVVMSCDQDLLKVYQSLQWFLAVSFRWTQFCLKVLRYELLGAGSHFGDILAHDPNFPTWDAKIQSLCVSNICHSVSLTRHFIQRRFITDDWFWLSYKFSFGNFERVPLAPVIMDGFGSDGFLATDPCEYMIDSHVCDTCVWGVLFS